MTTAPLADVEPNTTVEVYGATVEVDWIGYPVVAETGPRCGSCSRRHSTVAAVRLCHAIAAEQIEQQEADARLKAAQLRHLEDRGYDEARAQEDYEARNGVIGFMEAWEIESPETFPGY